jgi:hypothetical protein
MTTLCGLDEGGGLAGEGFGRRLHLLRIYIFALLHYYFIEPSVGNSGSWKEEKNGQSNSGEHQ